MLKTRVIPTLLMRDGALVKGVGFESWRGVGGAMQGVKVFNARDVDELVLLDIGATPQGGEPDWMTLEDLARECFVPLTIGGGVRSIAHFERLLEIGADKVAVNSAAYESPHLIEEAARRFGVQCVVASIDVRRDGDGRATCVSGCGAQSRAIDPAAWAREVEQRGAGEILLTRVEYDGAMTGYDCDLIRAVSEAVSAPVIASGGAGRYEHMAEALAAGASAVAAGAMFQFTQATPAEAKAFLAARGVRVRRSAGPGLVR
ncbi:MAG: imidazole glycerol phosphate synthase cyclase subunit [Alphaproteobacteria bacterium]|nr:imidazole glycerol phosphate synthase cyclase subunit [Alphaproteobacteria bacterium]